jgi:cytochrome P450
MVRLRDQYGDAVPGAIGPRRGLFVSHPQHCAELLAARERTFEPLRLCWAFRRALGQGVLVSTGEAWRRKRAFLQPAVRPRQVRSYAPVMVECALTTGDGWREGELVDVQHEMVQLSMRVLLRTLFGDDAAKDVETLTQAALTVNQVAGAEQRGASQFLPGWVRTPARRRLVAALDIIDAEFYRILEMRGSSAAKDDEPDDLVGRLLAVRDAEGRRLSSKEIRDEIFTLWEAGHDTTSVALTWTWYLLSAAPAARTRLRDELDRVLGGRPPTVDDYDHLTWTRHIVQEALRLYPPSWLLPPVVAREGAALGGTAIRPGTIVTCSPWLVHRDPRWYSHPDEFRPERWAAEATEPVRADAWFPFGGGQRACMGARFAQVELALVLAALAQRFDLDVVSGPCVPRVGTTLHPATPVYAEVRRSGRSPRGPRQVVAQRDGDASLASRDPGHKRP